MGKTMSPPPPPPSRRLPAPPHPPPRSRPLAILSILSFLLLLLLFPGPAVGLSVAPSPPAVGGGGATGRSGDKIPVTVLSGFLGSGKTTLLRHLLQNEEGLKIAVVVNDVAQVNIDSRLVVGQTTVDEEDREGKPDAIVQLSNGCACCSLSEELLGSVNELIMLSDMRQEEDRFDHIVVELSGVAEPRAVRGNFQDAEGYNMPLMDRVRLDTMVTVVDCSTFLDQLRSGAGATPEDSPELFYRTEGERLEAEERRREVREMFDDLPPKLRDALLSGDKVGAGYTPSEPGAEGVADAGVSDLLVEQTEVADVILLNKVDILRDDGELDKLGEIEAIVSALNPRATVMETEFGRVERLESVLGVAGGAGVASAGVVDDHKDFVEAAEGGRVARVVKTESACTDPDCADPTHSHSHSHDHAGAEADCTDPDCADPTHSHSHTHDHAEAESACTDPDCTDPTHSHSHSHDHAAAAGKTTSYDGIGNYVYRARRPFHPRRIAAFIRELPVKRGAPAEDMTTAIAAGTQRGGGAEPAGDNAEAEASAAAEAEAAAAAGGDSRPPEISDGCRRALKRVLRSKGFAWLADSDEAALYWSHAGSSFEMQCLGRWWATLPRNQWPPEAADTILAEFDSPAHEDGDPASVAAGTVGDRRQEIVFIGPTLGDPDRRGDICDALDVCLLDDGEWETYCKARSDEGELRRAFLSPIRSRVVSY